jgi:adenosylmethionine-8-amino-7-oxononanoate aminotransferase
MQDYIQQDPLIVSHGEGAYLYDIVGNKYFDGNSSLWLNTFGHCHPKINNAIKSQLDTIAHSTMLGLANVPATRLAKRLVEITPPGLDKVFFSDNGSTAGEIAIKMAFQYWQQVDPPQKERTSFITFDNAYHGDTLGGVSMGGFPLFHGIFGPLLFKRYSVSYPVYSKYTSKESPEQINAKCLQQVEDVLVAHGETIAAVMIEPLVQGASGIVTQSPGFLRGLRELCDRYHTLLITDEVFTGFGRTGTLFACDREGITPDFMTLAKSLTAGYLPIAVTLTTQTVFEGFLGEYEEFRTFFHGHSFTGNQLGCAAALANLELFESENVMSSIQQLGNHLGDCLDALFDTSDKVKDIHHIGFIAGIDLCCSRRNSEDFTLEEQAGTRVCIELRKHGIWLRPLGNTLVLVPPYITTTDEIDYLVDSIIKCLDSLE